MRVECTTKVQAKCMLKRYRISQLRVGRLAHAAACEVVGPLTGLMTMAHVGLGTCWGLPATGCSCMNPASALGKLAKMIEFSRVSP